MAVVRKRKCPATDERLAICAACEHLKAIRKTTWCGICKCYIPAKARVEDEKCPLGRWQRKLKLDLLEGGDAYHHST